MIPADAADIRKEYQILNGELKKHNPELMDKDRLLAITKSDLLDEELMTEMKEELPEVETLFISSVTGLGIQPLKDKIWQLLNNWHIGTSTSIGKEIVIPRASLSK